jgi:hypothetical protein
MNMTALPLDQPTDLVVDEDAGLDQDEDGAEVYWAKKKGGELVSALRAKEQAYFEAVTRRGLLTMWRIAYAQYYGLDPAALGDFATQQISFTGPEAEFIRFRINEVRSFIKQQNTMAMGERPAFQCISVNTDYQSMAQVEICDQIINYLYRRSSGEQRERELLEVDGVFGVAYGWDRWDHDAGDDVDVMQDVPGMTDPQTGQLAQMPVKQKSGAPRTTVLYPWEVIQEPYSREANGWMMVRERCSKWELAAQYPEHSAKLTKLSTLDEYAISELFGFDLDALTSDDCIAKHFYHPRCKALPEGRYVGVAGDMILWDTTCPVTEGTPITELCTGKFFGTAFGYADSWDLCSINEMIDQLCSDTASNLATFGRQTMVVDEGTKYDVDLIALGHRVLTKNPAAKAPEVIEFAEMPEATKWFLEYLHKRHESISGLNSVARGDPGNNISSGQMAALFHSIAIEYQSGRQASLDSYRERSANLKLDMVRMFADAPFVAEIVGVDERPYMQEFTRQDVSGIRRVMVTTANPLMRSIAGRLQVFESIKDLDITQRAAAIELILTGQSKAFTRQDRTCDMRIRWENEQLAKGTKCQVLALDNPFKHVPQHFAEIEARSAELQANPQAMAAYLEHIMEHGQVYLQLDPNLAQMMQIPLPMMPGMPGMPGAPMPGAPANDNAAAPSKSAKPDPMSQQVDPSGVKLPSPAQPPAGSAAAPTMVA